MTFYTIISKDTKQINAQKVSQVPQQLGEEFAPDEKKSTELPKNDCSISIFNTVPPTTDTRVKLRSKAGKSKTKENMEKTTEILEVKRNQCKF